MAGCRMAMKGRPLAKQGYEQELTSIRAFVSMQNKADGSSGHGATDHGVSCLPRAGDNVRAIRSFYVWGMKDTLPSVKRGSIAHLTACHV